MFFAAVYDGPYNVVYLLHVISVILGTGAAFIGPVAASRMRSAGQSSEAMNDTTAAITAPALLAAGVFGGALVGMSDDFYDFGQSWLLIGGAVWLVAVGAAALAYPPSYLPVPDMIDKRPMISGILHLSLAVMLVLMTWKFGAP